jgi:predicted permease
VSSNRPVLDLLRPRVRRAFRLAVHRADWTESEVDEELRFHVAMRVEQLVAAGWAPADAEAEARRRFGPSWDAAVRHLHRSGRAREEQLAMHERLGAVWHDVRYALRGLRRAPRFVAAVVLTLGLGIGASTVIFSFVDHIVLRPLPYASPDQLVVVREILGEVRSVYPTMPANASHFLEWRRGCSACAGLSAIKRSWVTLTGNDDPQRLGAARVSANLFPLLGLTPVLGRGFVGEEEQPGRDRVVLLSNAAWRRHFGADPSIVGRRITLNARSVEIIGVLPPAADLPGGDGLGKLVGLPERVDMYQPLALTEAQTKSSGEYDYAVLARLRPDATIAQAQQQINAIEREFTTRMGDGATLEASVVPLRSQIVGESGRPLLLLLAAVGTVLLIVCVNLINLSLARSMGRQRETAVRVALGAGAGRLALVESLILALAGGMLGLLLAVWGLRSLIALAPSSLPRVAEVGLDARVFGASMLLTLFVGMLVGTLPAIRAGRTHPGEALKAGGRTMTSGRGAGRRRTLFIAAQVAFSTLLLVGTGLFLTSFVRLLRVDPGFDTEHVVALDVALPAAAYPTGEHRLQFYERAMAEISAVSGITATGVTSALPLEGETWIDAVSRADQAGGSGEPLTANFRFVTDDYFKTIGTPLRQGRPFGADDRGQQVVIVSERTASALWPGGSAIGQRMSVGSSRPSAEVVGVVADVRTSTLEETGSLVVYLPMRGLASSQAVMIARTAGVANDVAAAAVRDALRRVDPTVAVPKIRTTGQVVSATLAARRFQLALLTLFALLALVTASVGIYGVISQSLASRTNEIGVRLALGAQPSDVHRLVLREGLTPIALGLAVGIAGSLAAGRVISSLLFEVRPGDPMTMASVGLLLGVVGVVACAIPARRATRTGLAVMLRAE